MTKQPTQLGDHSRTLGGLRMSLVLRHLNNDLSDVLLAVQVFVRLPEMLEVEHFVDDRAQLDHADQTVHVLKSMAKTHQPG